MARGVTIPAPELHAWLDGLGVDIRQGRKSVLAVVDGREIRIPTNDRKAQVGDRTLSDLARGFGTTKNDLIEAITGKTRPRAGKQQAASEPERPPIGRDANLAAIEDLRHLLGGMAGFLRAGKRGQEIHDAYADALSVALRAIRPVWDRTVGAAREASTVAIESPDDSKYRPQRHDPLTTGAARFRADGPSARLARKGKTETHYELTQKGDL
jgi:hypothetical protein